LNEDGEPLRCKATQGRCPYAADKHFSSKEEAREAFEKLQASPMVTVSRSVPHEMTLSAPTTKLLERLEKEGLRPFVVGGSVRDSMLSGAVPKDIDIEVFDAEDMDQLETVLRKAGYKVDSVGKSFGVLKMALPGGDDIDVTLKSATVTAASRFRWIPRSPWRTPPVDETSPSTPSTTLTAADL
jgi:hypothetical protein